MRKSRWWLVGSLAATGLIASAAVKRRQAFLRQRAHNRRVSVLVIGADVVGSAYAVRLARWGMDVTILASGSRLQELDAYGMQVRDVLTRRLFTVPLRVVTSIPPGDECDLVVLAVRSGEALHALDLVKPLVASTPVLVMQSHSMEIEPLAEQLADRSVLLGFPATSGACIDGIVHSLPLWLSPTVIGESDGTSTQRLRQTASILRRAGLRVEVQRQMVSWLRTHAAMTAVMAACINRNGGRMRRMGRNTDEIRLYLLALREAFDVLEASGIPVTPRAQLKVFERPARLQAAMMRIASVISWAEFAVDHHVADAIDETKASCDELIALAECARVDVPALRLLQECFPV